MKVSKVLTFDAAHMLSNYDGKCNNLHGHTYKVCVTLEGVSDEETGMLVDFNNIKKIVDEFDHAIIFGGFKVREKAEDVLFAWATEFNKRMYVMPEAMKPTAENMAKVLAEMLRALPNVHIATVQVWETPTAYAEAEA